MSLSSLRAKTKLYGIFLFSTVTVVGSIVNVQEDEVKHKKSSLIVRVISHQGGVADAKLTLLFEEEKRRENWTTDNLGYGRALPRDFRNEIGIHYERPPGRYTLTVEKEPFVSRTVSFYLPEEGYEEQVIQLREPARKKKRKTVEEESRAYSWGEKVSMPTSRLGMAVEVVKSQIYLIGGWQGEYLNTVEHYNPVTNRWQSRNPMKVTRDHHAAIVYKNRIYVFGGHNQQQPKGIDTVEVYDPFTDHWTTTTAMPEAGFSFTVNEVGGKIYLIGGKGREKQVHQFDPETERWTKKRPMPTARYRHASVVVGGKIYVIGGRNRREPLSTTMVYDPKIDYWSRKSSMPDSRYMHIAKTVQGKIYVIGGKGKSKRVLEYHPGKDQWHFKTSMQPSRYNLSAGVIGDKIYLLGGNGGLNRNEFYIPVKDPYSALHDENGE